MKSARHHWAVSAPDPVALGLSTMRSDDFHSAPHVVSALAAGEFDSILDGVDARSAPPRLVGPPVDLSGRIERPLWQLLVHAAASGRFALHGSGSDDIVEFEPRQSNDVDEFGNREGVYAAADGLWPYYFAIVDRGKIESLVNAAFLLVDPVTGAESGPRYFFSVASAESAPWRNGTVYLLPIHGFERQADTDGPDGRVRSTQLFCAGAVRPVARVRVRPSEFPLLDAIQHHDTAEVTRRVAADPDGFPWL